MLNPAIQQLPFVLLARRSLDEARELVEARISLSVIARERIPRPRQSHEKDEMLKQVQHDKKDGIAVPSARND
jgi:hypothetical protein